ncbi:hypothetical protein DH2020_011027 [Rehmannia glutinosa]|uniref:Uncharacterized protein n=1 Tax=Rehmannia glutinosa TaxID=99300 RepID=A0ABR0XCA2_REHGL
MAGRQTNHRDLPPCNLRCGGSVDQGLREKDQSEEVQVQPALPAAPKFGLSNWVKWLLGSIISFMLPLWTNKWHNLLTLEGKAVKVVEEVEVVAEVVEKVATTTDKALAEVVNQLPDNSKLKEAAQIMEHVSSVAAQDAQLIENIFHKAGDVKQDVEELEKMVEPIVDEIIKGKHPKISRNLEEPPIIVC